MKISRNALHAALICMGLLIISCTSASEVSSLRPPPEPNELWTYITRTSDYTLWRHWPGYEGKFRGTTLRGAWIELYANEEAIEAAEAGKETMPYGAIIVKENYARDRETLLSVTPMYKVRGYDAKASDWFWAEFDPEGNTRAGGRVQSCIRCHEASPHDFRYIRPKGS